MHRLRSSYICAKYHPGLCSPFIHSVASREMILLADSEGPDQTAQMRKLIWAFSVRLYPKTRLSMARPICCLNQSSTEESFNILKCLKSHLMFKI